MNKTAAILTFLAVVLLGLIGLSASDPIRGDFSPAVESVIGSTGTDSVGASLQRGLGVAR